MSPNYAFETLYEEAELDDCVGLIYQPVESTSWEIGPHRPGTGVLLLRADGSVLVTCPYGFVPTFNFQDLVCARLAAEHQMIAA